MDPLRTIRQRIEAGDREEAKRQLCYILRQDPQNAPAWALLAPLLEDPAQQVDCYRQILRADPHNQQAAAKLRALTGSTTPPPRTDQPISPTRESTPGGALPRPVEASAPTRKPGLLGGLLHLLGVNAEGASPAPRRPTLTGFGQASPRQEPLSPEDVIQLAGGPLPPEERQTCPKCEAVVARGAARCPWCETPLSDTRS